MRPPIDFYIAEVVNNEYTYLDQNKSGLYGIFARTYNTDNPQQLFCLPADSNIKKIPLRGEHVFIYKGLTPDSNNSRIRTQWYYMSTLPLQSSVHLNSLPNTATAETRERININSTVPQTSTNSLESLSFGQTFNERNDVPLLQPYEGDILIEGRFGNSIRMGSSHGQTEGGRYSQLQSTSWNGQPGQPLIILSNKRPVTGKNFSLENIQNDYSSLYLTSGQEIRTLQFTKQLTKSNNFSGSELIGSADRIIMQSKTSNIILDAATRVSMNTEEVFLGSESGPHSPIPKGDVLEQILRAIISAIRAGQVGSGGIYSLPTPGNSSLRTAEILLSSLSSNRVWIDKNNKIG